MADLLSNLPIELREFIFGFLSLVELKICSLVSKKWYKLVGDSHQAMNKFNLCVNEDQLAGNFQVLLHSTRNFKSIKIDVCSVQFNDLIKKILFKFSTSIENIMSNVDMKLSHPMPRVKKISFMRFIGNQIYSNFSYPFDLEGFLLKATNLEELVILNETLDIMSLEVVKEVLSKKKTLKALSINCDKIVKDLSNFECPFMLELFSYTGYKSIEIENKIDSFLLSHRESLKQLELTYSSEEVVNICLSKFPKLETLSFGSLNFTKSAKHDPSINKGINSLKIYEQLGESQNYVLNLELVLEKLTGLEVLEVNLLCGDILNKILKHKSLITVKYESLSSVSFMQHIEMLNSHIKFMSI